MSKSIVIVNPTAGRGRGAKLVPQVAERLRGHGLEFDLVTTAGPDHATALARDAAVQGAESVIVVGGDGTFNEVLNGLMQVQDTAEGAALGVVPIGTGNDFAYGAGLSLEMEKACRAVARDQSRTLDVGLFDADNEEPRFFGNGIGIGFDAMANLESRKVNHLSGTLLYLVAVIRTLLFYYQNPRITIRIDDREWTQSSLLISVMNGQRMGGGFYITPTSRMDDGVLDICVAAKVSRAKMVRFVPRFLRGTHITDPDITMDQGCRVTVESDAPWVAHVDGEIYGVGGQHYAVELFPGRLRLLG